MKKSMEIGSFIELQMPEIGELYSQTSNIARLNTGRASIWHAFRCTGCKAIWLPYYECDTVRNFLKFKNVTIKYYHIDSNFNPIDLFPLKEDAVLIVNYFGIMSFNRLSLIAKKYAHTIIDDAQALFTIPIDGCYNVYSCRKFIGVPDGAYVIGDKAEKFCDEYDKGYSSDTSLFLLQRIEYGCEGKAYESRQLNESRLNTEDVKLMSKLTQTILKGTYYQYVKEKRKKNFEMVHKLLSKVNLINPMMYYDETCVPMVYPLVVENDEMLSLLQEEKHFQGHWWSYLVDEMNKSTFEYWLSRYIIPITIDQRYGQNEIEYICMKVLGGE